MASIAIPLKLTDDAPEMVIVKVGSDTAPKMLAHSLAAQLRVGSIGIVMHAIGHGAVGQAMKAATILNTMTINAGVIYTVLPSLIDVTDAVTKKVMTVQRLRLVSWAVGG